MDFLWQIGLFGAKFLILFVFILAVVMLIVAVSSKEKADSKEKLKIKKLNDKLDAYRDKLETNILDKKHLKARRKAEKKADKAKHKTEKQKPRPRIFVVNFHGDIKAGAVEPLREVVTALLTVADSRDEIVLRLESGGGMVNTYGFGASQLQRIRDKNIPLTVCVDKVAASGGYMMACVANKIIAAPFAYIGSIGVLAQLPNFNRWLKKHNIDFEQVSAGEFKRTLTVFGENTDKGRKKFQTELEEIHDLFKDHIKQHRPQVDLDENATGEHWLASVAHQRRLVDHLQTSDDYLSGFADSHDIFEVSFAGKEKLLERFFKQAQAAFSSIAFIK
jgi:serine protease SohB